MNLDSFLDTHDQWRHEDDALVAEFKFDSFLRAVSFIVQVAMIAERMNHHPTIVNTYSKVTIALSTHDAGNTVTGKDIETAKAISAL